ncbi:hypothetical protein DL764_007047 [Monosporascus ibericus]|uniref:N-acetyltransferase domain-containing protein n=1 Tax=Monosporascus ibericus TaxID=155417 RepID=A0A4Q4T543_9PEZI|nr:hypothetical protein DL764_007047 [Monosporascus ibericus]
MDPDCLQASCRKREHRIGPVQIIRPHLKPTWPKSVNLSNDAGRRIEHVSGKEEGCRFYLWHYKPFRLAALQQDPDALYSRPEAYGRGLSSALMKVVVERAVKEARPQGKHLELKAVVYASDTSAIAFYEKCRFVAGGSRQSVNHVRDPERAVELGMCFQPQMSSSHNDNYEGDRHDVGDRDDDDDDDCEDDDCEQDEMELPPSCTKDRARDLGCEHIKCICEQSADGFLQKLATSILHTCKTLTGFRDELDRLPSACDKLDIKIPDSVIEHASYILNSFTSYPGPTSKSTSELPSTRMASSAEVPRTSPTTTGNDPGKTTKTTVEETSPATSQPAASATLPETSADTSSSTSAVTAPAGGDPSIPPTETSPSTDQAPPMPTGETSESIDRTTMSSTKTSEPTDSRQPSTTDTIVPGTGSAISPTVSVATGAETREGPVVTNGGSPFDSPVSGGGAEQPGRSLARLVLGLAAVAALG